MPSTPDYTSTLQWLFRQLPMYQRVGPKAFKKNLDNILALCAALNHPERQFPSVHIAGTNGKGSTAHFLAAVFQTHGFRTGLYTSPHYRDFRERIKINGQYVSKDWIVSFVQQHQELMKAIHPSFFEITVAMAFEYFSRENVDIAIIETGLGGRLDSTNVITPLLSTITNIGFDHMNFLGDTLPLIAGEKAGIIKPGVPVIIGETHPETRPVFETKARQTNSPISFAQDHWQCDWLGQSPQGARYRVAREGLPEREILLNAGGRFQQKNLVTALESLYILQNEGHILLNDKQLKEAFAQVPSLTNFKGRWQILGRHPLILADSAHNPEGVREVWDQIDTYSFDRLHVVLGTVNDKDLDRILPLYPTNAHYYFARPDIPRGLAAEELQRQAARFNLEGTVYENISQALKAAKEAAEKTDLIFVGGSTFTVAEVV